MNKKTTMAGYINEISNILIQKLTAYDEFLSVTEHLQEALEREDLMAINHLIMCREELIREIERLDCQYRHDKPLVSSSDRSTTTTREMEKISEDLAEKLRQIISTSQNCKVLATNSCEAARKDLMGIDQKKESLQRYGIKTQRIPKFLSIQT